MNMEKTVMTYKGVVLKENNPNKMLHMCPYAVYLKNGNRFEFSSIAEFKRIVNCEYDESLGIMEICPDGKWRGGGVKQVNFKQYALDNQISDGLKFTEPHDGDFFSITEDSEGNKYVEILGFNWFDDGRWHFTETRHCGIPIAEFIENYKEFGMDYVENKIMARSRQTQYDLSKREALVDYTKKAFNGQPPVAYLSYDEITPNTPCGNYAC